MEFTKEQKILQQVINEAWSNPTFKQELMDVPQEAIKKLTGETFDIPEGKKLQVFDQSDKNVICLNIPQQPNLENMQLTDQQLELVAGGKIAAALPDGGLYCVRPWVWETGPGKGATILPTYDK